jgi:hypothetical protein
VVLKSVTEAGEAVMASRGTSAVSPVTLLIKENSWCRKRSEEANFRREQAEGNVQYLYNSDRKRKRSPRHPYPLVESVNTPLSYLHRHRDLVVAPASA